MYFEFIIPNNRDPHSKSPKQLSPWVVVVVRELGTQKMKGDTVGVGQPKVGVSKGVPVFFRRCRGP